VNPSWYYLLVLLATGLGPALLLFLPPQRSYLKWKAYATAVLVILLIYIPWDMAFTAMGEWQFNSTYISGIWWGNLPMEEWLFFIITPWSCLFVLDSMHFHFPALQNQHRLQRMLVLTCMASIVALLLLGEGGNYTWTASGIALALLVAEYQVPTRISATVLLAYLVLLVPLILCNGILTGIEFWEHPILNRQHIELNRCIVYYHPHTISGWRIFTIPVEDLVYGLGFYLLGSRVFLRFSA
jgi:lycopene cyclase domain-containing protein